MKLFLTRNTENSDNMLITHAQVKIREQWRMTVALVITSDWIYSEWGEHQPLVEKPRAKLQKYYDYIVLGDEMLPDQPHRCLHCTANIFLKPSAQPKIEAHTVAGRKKRSND